MSDLTPRPEDVVPKEKKGIVASVKNFLKIIKSNFQTKGKPIEREETSNETRLKLCSGWHTSAGVDPDYIQENIFFHGRGSSLACVTAKTIAPRGRGILFGNAPSELLPSHGCTVPTQFRHYLPETLAYTRGFYCFRLSFVIPSETVHMQLGKFRFFQNQVEQAQDEQYALLRKGGEGNLKNRTKSVEASERLRDENLYMRISFGFVDANNRSRLYGMAPKGGFFDGSSSKLKTIDGWRGIPWDTRDDIFCYIPAVERDYLAVSYKNFLVSKLFFEEPIPQDAVLTPWIDLEGLPKGSTVKLICPRHLDQQTCKLIQAVDVGFSQRISWDMLERETTVLSSVGSGMNEVTNDYKSWVCVMCHGRNVASDSQCVHCSRKNMRRWVEHPMVDVKNTREDFTRNRQAQIQGDYGDLTQRIAAAKKSIFKFPPGHPEHVKEKHHGTNAGVQYAGVNISDNDSTTIERKSIVSAEKRSGVGPEDTRSLQSGEDRETMAKMLLNKEPTMSDLGRTEANFHKIVMGVDDTGATDLLVDPTHYKHHSPRAPSKSPHVVQLKPDPVKRLKKATRTCDASMTCAVPVQLLCPEDELVVRYSDFSYATKRTDEKGGERRNRNKNSVFFEMPGSKTTSPGNSPRDGRVSWRESPAMVPWEGEAGILSDDAHDTPITKQREPAFQTLLGGETVSGEGVDSRLETSNIVPKLDVDALNRSKEELRSQDGTVPRTEWTVEERSESRLPDIQEDSKFDEADNNSLIGRRMLNGCVYLGQMGHTSEEFRGTGGSAPHEEEYPPELAELFGQNFKNPDEGQDAKTRTDLPPTSRLLQKSTHRYEGFGSSEDSFEQRVLQLGMPEQPNAAQLLAWLEAVEKANAVEDGSNILGGGLSTTMLGGKARTVNRQRTLREESFEDESSPTQTDKSKKSVMYTKMYWGGGSRENSADFRQGQGQPIFQVGQTANLLISKNKVSKADEAHGRRLAALRRKREEKESERSSPTGH